jgi:hypothetical protein
MARKRPRPARRGINRFKDAIRAKTPRKVGRSLYCIIADVNRTTRGWFEYFGHASYTTVFRELEGWIRLCLLRRKPICRRFDGFHNSIMLATVQCGVCASEGQLPVKCGNWPVREIRYPT